MYVCGEYWYDTCAVLSLQQQVVHCCLTPIIVNIITSVRHGACLSLVGELCKLE